MPTSSLDRDIESRLRDRQIRYTKGRRLVVGALAGSDGPLSAAELQDAIGRTVPLSSLYRSLVVLQESGVVIPHFGTKGITRYELAEWITGHHHHLVCVICGTVEDIDIPQATEDRVRTLADEIAANVGFLPVNHTLEIEGRCSTCR